MDNRLRNIERKLDNQDNKLDNIEKAITRIAVQDERISNLESKNSILWKKMDKLTDTDGDISKLQIHQASCPRGQMKWLWLCIIPISFTIITIGISLLYQMPIPKP